MAGATGDPALQGLGDKVIYKFSPCIGVDDRSLKETKERYLWILKCAGIRDAERVANTILGVIMMLEERRVRREAKPIKVESRLVRKKCF